MPEIVCMLVCIFYAGLTNSMKNGIESDYGRLIYIRSHTNCSSFSVCNFGHMGRTWNRGLMHILFAAVSFMNNIRCMSWIIFLCWIRLCLITWNYMQLCGGWYLRVLMFICLILPLIIWEIVNGDGGITMSQIYFL